MQKQSDTKKSMVKSITSLLALGVLLVLTALSKPATAQTTQQGKEPIYKDFKTEMMWEAKVKIADMILVGDSKNGVRRVIPILGGTFEGPGIRGEVLPGGEDWQRVRPDGDTELSARYLMKTHDGHVIQVINNVLIHSPKDQKNPAPYIRSVVDLEAPSKSPYDYLNHAIFLGTLNIPQLKQGEAPYVIITVYRVL